MAAGRHLETVPLTTYDDEVEVLLSSRSRTPSPCAPQSRRSKPWTRKQRFWFSSIISIVVILFFPRIQWFKAKPPNSLRPALHFAAPPNTWLNDPNGLFIDDDDIWHMYYQHRGTYKGGPCKNWGHATSKDLYSWTIHPLALKCEEYAMYSGSIVIDRNNTSGLFPPGHANGVVALYTQHDTEHGTEEQSVAYSLDGGFTFTLYPKNPVLKLRPRSYGFRDPKVIWHEPTQRWVMTVAYAARQKVAFYASSNLLDWDVAFEFSNPHLSERNDDFECPNLVPISYINPGQTEPIPRDPSDSWLLLVSSGRGSPQNGGSVTKYFPGRFNGTHFEAIDTRSDRDIDFGPDNYATQYFHGTTQGHLTGIGWAANLATCANTTSGTREHWRGMMTLPRTAALVEQDGDVLYLSKPVGLDALRGTVLGEFEVDEGLEKVVEYAQSGPRALLLEAYLTLSEDQLERDEPKFTFAFKSSKSQEEVFCSLNFFNYGTSFVCDRSKAIGDWNLSGKMTAMSTHKIPPWNGDTTSFSMQAIIDSSILEVFLNKGLKSGTMTVFPEHPFDTVWFKTIGSGLTGTVLIQELYK